MSGVRITRVRHDCDMPSLVGVQPHECVNGRWRCPVCGQRWKGTWAPGSYSAEGVGRPRWRWQRRERARLRTALRPALPEPVTVSGDQWLRVSFAVRHAAGDPLELRKAGPLDPDGLEWVQNAHRLVVPYLWGAGTPDLMFDDLKVAVEPR